jgi:hypothetical protein
MAEHGQHLGVILGDLWLCGRYYVPKMADIYIQANGSVAGTDGDSGSFGRTGYVGNTGFTTSVPGQVYPVWNQVRNEFQRILGQSATNLYDVGDALISVANGYAATDHAAQVELAHQMSEYTTGGQFTLDDPTRRPKPIDPPS